jgi:hypothetical protein
MRVPSVVVPSEANVLINPRHARATEILYEPLEPVSLDPRLVSGPFTAAAAETPRARTTSRRKR